MHIHVIALGKMFCKHFVSGKSMVQRFWKQNNGKHISWEIKKWKTHINKFQSTFSKNKTIGNMENVGKRNSWGNIFKGK